MSNSSEPPARSGIARPGPGLLFAFGNLFRGDDGIGPRLVGELQAASYENGFEAFDLGNDGLKFLALLENRRGPVLLLDCALFDGEPGDSRFIIPSDVRERAVPAGLSTHEGDVLCLARTALDLYPELRTLSIYAIRGARFEFKTDLSPEVTGGIPRYKTDILRYFREN